VNRKRFWVWVLGLALAGHLAAETRLPREVVKHPRPQDALSARLEWALGEAGRAGSKDGFWVGYAIRRLMSENSYIGSVHTGWRDEVTLAEVLSGKTVVRGAPQDESVGRTARRVLDELENRRKPEPKVWKDIAILLRHGPEKGSALEKVTMSDVTLAVDLKGLPLYWLGEATDAESLTELKAIYAKTQVDKVKEHLVAAVGIHGSTALTVPVLRGVLEGRDTDGVRKDAAFWLSQQDEASVVGLLVRTAKSDRSAEVRKSAVFGLSQVDRPEAVDEIIGLARNAQDDKVRRDAVFWLSQMASKKAGPALEEFALNDRDVKVQEHAVFALAELPDGQGIEPLIRIAKTHPDARVRKKAIFWLGETRDPRALDTLVAIVKGK